MNNNTNHDLKAISNELYDINERQEFLKERKRELKSMMADGMGSKVYKDVNGTIKKISPKLKRIYDRSRHKAEFKRQGLSKDAIERIVKSSTRQINVSGHLSLKPKRKE